MKIIVVTGTPGTGKTRYAKKLAKQKDYQYVDVKKLIKTNKIFEKYDKKNKCYVVDHKKLIKFLSKLILEKNKSNKIRQTKQLKGLVLDSHLSHYLSKDLVDGCIVMRCNLKVLEKRLKVRGYSKQKIRDNVDAEIMESCLQEAISIGHRVKVVWSSKK